MTTTQLINHIMDHRRLTEIYHGPTLTTDRITCQAVTT